MLFHVGALPIARMCIGYRIYVRFGDILLTGGYTLKAKPSETKKLFPKNAICDTFREYTIVAKVVFGSPSESVALLLFLLLFLKLRHLGGNLFHLCRGIVGQAVANEGGLHLLLADFSENFVCAANARIIEHGIVIVFGEKVIATVLRRRLVGLRQVGRIAHVVLGGIDDYSPNGSQPPVKVDAPRQMIFPTFIR